MQAFGVDHIPFIFSNVFSSQCTSKSFTSRYSFVSECRRYLKRFLFPLCFRSRSFKDVTSFKPFNSTGATSLLNHFNGVSLEWALTHRSFPGSYPTLLFSWSYPNFFSKCDIRMNFHQSEGFSKIFQILFIIGSTSLF